MDPFGRLDGIGPADVAETRPVLLVLDNCDPVVDGLADEIAGLLAADPTLTVLATSREPLRGYGERRVPAGPPGPAPAVRSGPRASCAQEAPAAWATFCGQVAQASGSAVPRYVRLSRSRCTRSSWLLLSSARIAAACGSSPRRAIAASKAAGSSRFGQRTSK